MTNTPEQQRVVDEIKLAATREHRPIHLHRRDKSNAEYARLATAAAHAVEKEGITIAEAAKRFDIAYHTAWTYHRRLYPNTDRRFK